MTIGFRRQGQRRHPGNGRRNAKPYLASVFALIRGIFRLPCL
jgi:hypothetical protein